MLGVQRLKAQIIYVVFGSKKTKGTKQDNPKSV